MLVEPAAKVPVDDCWLREDYKRYLEARGQRFSLRDFHDRFLQLGLPVSLARQALMPGDTGPSLE